MDDEALWDLLDGGDSPVKKKARIDPSALPKNISLDPGNGPANGNLPPPPPPPPSIIKMRIPPQEPEQNTFGNINHIQAEEPPIIRMRIPDLVSNSEPPSNNILGGIQMKIDGEAAPPPPPGFPGFPSFIAPPPPPMHQCSNEKCPNRHASQVLTRLSKFCGSCRFLCGDPWNPARRVLAEAVCVPGKASKNVFLDFSVSQEMLNEKTGRLANNIELRCML